jgi:hypothetical protein
VRTIVRERIPTAAGLPHPLGRHITHDSESWRYAWRSPQPGRRLSAVRHTRRIPVLDQGQLGSCTGQAGIGCLGTDPFYATLIPGALASSAGLTDGDLAQIKASFIETVLGDSVTFASTRDAPWYSLDEAGAVALYSAATGIDDYPGEYPPDDTGSDGLSIAKALTAAGMVSGYRWAFTPDDALDALQHGPVITGVPWYTNSFDPDPVTGIVSIGGDLAGGHEFVVDEYDPDRNVVGCTNSWGTGWGLAGRFYLRVDDWATLLSRQGDVTVFAPLTEPAPTPSPDPALAADQAFAAALRLWAFQRHVGRNGRAAKAGRTWLWKRGL